MNDLYRQTKAAQRRAERRGLTGTAAALAGIGAMMALEHGVDAVVVQELARSPGSDPDAPF